MAVDPRHLRYVILTPRHVRLSVHGDEANDHRWGWGHRHPNGVHANTPINETCTQCLVEHELSALHTAHAAQFNLAPRQRWWPGR